MSDIFEKLRTQLKQLEHQASPLKTAVSNSRWTSSRLWIVLGAIMGLIVLQRYGLNFGDIISHIVFLVALLVISRTITDSIHSLCQVADNYVWCKYGGRRLLPEKPAPIPLNDDAS